MIPAARSNEVAAPPDWQEPAGDDSPAASNGLARAPSHVMVLAEDALVREGLRKLLTTHDVLEAEAAGSIDELEKTIASSRAQVALWYADYADGESIARLCVLRDDYGVGVCIVAQSFDVWALREAYCTRADGLAVLLRGSRLQMADVARAMVQLSGGGVVISSSILEQLIVDSRARGEHLLCQLTEQEHAVLDLLATGLRNRAIAERLGRSEKAVEKHVGRIFSKLHLAGGANDVDRRVKAARIQLFAQTSAGEPPA